MAFVPTPNVARVAIQMSLFNELVVNTLWFLNPGAVPYDIANLQILANEVEFWWTANMAPELSSSLNLDAITATAQDALDAPSVTFPFNVPGQQVSAGMPGSVCITVKFNTAQRGRSGRGRNYVSGLTETQCTGNSLSSATALNLRLAYENIPNDITNGTHVVVSFQLDGVKRAAGFVQEVLSYEIVDTNLDSQRRRLNNRGA